MSRPSGVYEIKWLASSMFQSTVYYCCRQPDQIKNLKSILFVCRGNICRSAFAEKALKDIAKESSITIESCGLNAGVGVSPPVEARITANLLGIDLTGHLSKPATTSLFEAADLIMAMEFNQYVKLVQLLPHKKGKIRLLREFAPFPERVFCNIRDPFGHSLVEYQHCFLLIKQAVENVHSFI